MLSSRASPEVRNAGFHYGASDDLARWPAALRLIAGLLRAEPDPGTGLEGAEWDEFADLVTRRHRIAPQILVAIQATGLKPPAGVTARLEGECRANALMALAHKAETPRLLAALAAHGCHPVMLKGWPLAEELLGSAAARHSKDIDLYVTPAEAETAVAVLHALGYEVYEEHQGRKPLIGRPVLLTECNDLALWNDAKGCQVEVHWRSTHYRGWTDLSAIDGQRRDWPLDQTGLSVHIPSKAANLVYLALHGQLHSWARLKWLHDIALMLRRNDSQELAMSLQAARRAGAGRAVVCAVHMVHRIFGDALPAGWPAPDWIARRMLRRFAVGIATASAAPGTLRGRFDFYWVGLVMGEGAAQRLGVLRYAFWREPRLRLERWLISTGEREAGR